LTGGVLFESSEIIRRALLLRLAVFSFV